MYEISSLAEELLVSQEGISSMDLVSSFVSETG